MSRTIPSFFTTRAISRTTLSGSRAQSSRKLQITRSNWPSPNGRSWASPTFQSTPVTLLAASSIMAGSTSKPVTVPLVCWAISSVMTPVPQPTSRTLPACHRPTCRYRRKRHARVQRAWRSNCRCHSDTERNNATPSRRRWTYFLRRAHFDSRCKGDTHPHKERNWGRNGTRR